MTPTRDVPRFTVEPTAGGSRTIPAPVESAPADPAPAQTPNLKQPKEKTDAGQS